MLNNFAWHTQYNYDLTALSEPVKYVATQNSVAWELVLQMFEHIRVRDSI